MVGVLQVTLWLGLVLFLATCCVPNNTAGPRRYANNVAVAGIPQCALLNFGGTPNPSFTLSITSANTLIRS
jgi:hypothetical protein